MTDPIGAAVKATANLTKASPMTQTSQQLAELALRSSRSMVAVIDAMASRGAYKGDELLAIGQLRDQATQVIKLAELVQSEAAEAVENSPK